MEDILREIISYKTVSTDTVRNGELISFIEHYLEARGMFTRRYESNGFHSLVATVQPNQKKPKVALVAHTDVVPDDHNQFTLRKENGRYYGRGVFDMKFSIAAYMWLVDQLQDELDNYDFAIIITSDEEVGGHDGVRALIHEGYRPQVCIVPDGGENWQMEEFAKGIQWVRLEAQGIAAHASRPWEGESAIAKLLAAIQDISTLFPAKPAKKDSLFSVGTIQGGMTTNQIAVHAQATLDIRHGSMADYQELYPKIRKMCHARGVTATLMVDDPPSINDPNDRLIQQFRDILIKTIGYDPGSSFAYATHDGRFFNALGVPCIIVEPEGNGRHKQDEWISVRGCEQFYAIVLEYIRSASSIHAGGRTKAVHPLPNSIKTP